MTEVQTPPPAAPDAPVAPETVKLFHTGKGFGPMSTSAGWLRPGESIDAPVALAEKLCRAYKHIRLAKDVIPGSDPRAVAENVKLKAEVEKLTKQLEEVKGDGTKAIADLEQKLALADAGDKAALQGVVRDFLAADSKKALEALQEKHKDIVA
ncbi:MAG: hypothetical protein V4510_10100 [bacterium]